MVIRYGISLLICVIFYKHSNYIENLGWNCLGLYPSDMMDVIKYRGVWWLIISSCCPSNPHGKAGNEERRKRQLRTKKSKLFEGCHLLSVQTLIDYSGLDCNTGVPEIRHKERWSARAKIVKRTRLFKFFFFLFTRLDSKFSQSGNWLCYLAFGCASYCVKLRPAKTAFFETLSASFT